MPSRATARVIQFHPLTYNWANRVRAVGGSIPDYKLSAIDPFIKRLVSTGLYSNNRSSLIRYLLVLSGGNSIQGCNVPLIDLDNVGNATLNNYVAADWTHSGLIGGGTRFTDLRWVPSQNMSNANGHMMIWKTVKDATNGGWGVQYLDSDEAWLMGRQGGQCFFGLSSNTDNGGSDLDAVGCQILTRLGSSKIYIRDRAILLDSTAGNSVMPTNPLWLHDTNTAPSVTTYLNADRVWVVGLGNGLTVGQAYIYHDALALLNSRIGA